MVYLDVRSSFVQTDPAFTRQKEVTLLPKCQRTGDLSQSAFAATGQQANINNEIVAITPFVRRVPILPVPHFENSPLRSATSQLLSAFTVYRRMSVAVGLTGVTA